MMNNTAALIGWQVAMADATPKHEVTHGGRFSLAGMIIKKPSIYPAGFKSELGTLKKDNIMMLHANVPPVSAALRQKVVQRCSPAPHGCAWSKDVRQLA